MAIPGFAGREDIRAGAEKGPKVPSIEVKEDYLGGISMQNTPMYSSGKHLIDHANIAQSKTVIDGVLDILKGVEMRSDPINRHADVNWRSTSNIVDSMFGSDQKERDKMRANLLDRLKSLK